MNVKLSICIPTYNRAYFLRESLDSILSSVTGFENEIEIVISDNASQDNTCMIVRDYQHKYPFIHYYRNKVNLLEKNYYIAASLAQGEYLWVFSDDDLMESHAVCTILEKIKENFDLIICNYSIWLDDFSRVIREKVLSFHNDIILSNHNDLLGKMGLRLGFISMVIIRRNLFLALPLSEYETYVEYGFPFLYAVYSGMPHQCRAYICAQPVLKQRGASFVAYGNKDWWYKCFVTGSSLIFEELIKKGYSKEAVFRAKHIVLKDYVMHDISYRRRNGENLYGLFSLMFQFYKRHWFFWTVIVPMLIMPKSLIWIGNKVINVIRNKEPLKLTCLA